MFVIRDQYGNDSVDIMTVLISWQRYRCKRCSGYDDDLSEDYRWGRSDDHCDDGENDEDGDNVSDGKTDINSKIRNNEKDSANFDDSGWEVTENWCTRLSLWGTEFLYKMRRRCKVVKVPMGSYDVDGEDEDDNEKDVITFITCSCPMPCSDSDSRKPKLSFRPWSLESGEERDGMECLRHSNTPKSVDTSWSISTGRSISVNYDKKRLLYILLQQNVMRQSMKVNVN